MTNVPGQIDIFDQISNPTTAEEKRILRAAFGDDKRELQKLPPEISEWYREHMADWWYGEEECTGCGQVEARQGLYVGHGVQFDQHGTQYLPGGPGMAAEGVCMLMFFTAYHAQAAQRLADKDPRFAGWRRQCHKHESPTTRKKCPDSHFAADAEHRARIATKVWGSDTWNRKVWVG